MLWYVHVNPSALRATEEARDKLARNEISERDFTIPPVWVVRPAVAPELQRPVTSYLASFCAVYDRTAPREPLPDTGGHGWAQVCVDTGESGTLLVNLYDNVEDLFTGEHCVWPRHDYLTPVPVERRFGEGARSVPPSGYGESA